MVERKRESMQRAASEMQANAVGYELFSNLLMKYEKPKSNFHLNLYVLAGSFFSFSVKYE
jgi:hypothetical protein